MKKKADIFENRTFYPIIITQRVQKFSWFIPAKTEAPVGLYTRAVSKSNQKLENLLSRTFQISDNSLNL